MQVIYLLSLLLFLKTTSSVRIPYILKDAILHPVQINTTIETPALSDEMDIEDASIELETWTRKYSADKSITKPMYYINAIKHLMRAPKSAFPFSENNETLEQRRPKELSKLPHYTLKFVLPDRLGNNVNFTVHLHLNGTIAQIDEYATNTTDTPLRDPSAEVINFIGRRMPTNINTVTQLLNSTIESIPNFFSKDVYEEISTHFMVEIELFRKLLNLTDNCAYRKKYENLLFSSDYAESTNCTKNENNETVSSNEKFDTSPNDNDIVTYSNATDIGVSTNSDDAKMSTNDEVIEIYPTTAALEENGNEFTLPSVQSENAEESKELVDSQIDKTTEVVLIAKLQTDCQVDFLSNLVNILEHVLPENDLGTKSQTRNFIYNADFSTYIKRKLLEKIKTLLSLKKDANPEMYFKNQERVLKQVLDVFRNGFEPSAVDSSEIIEGTPMDLNSQEELKDMIL